MQFLHQPTKNFFLKKQFLIAFFGALLGVSICYFIQYSEQEDQFEFAMQTALLASLLGAFIFVFLVQVASYLNKIFTWQKNVGVRLFAGFISNFCITIVFSIGLFYVYKLIENDTTDFFKSNFSVFIKLAIIVLILALIFEIIYFALYSYYSFSKLQIETVKQERKQIELQLKALKSQLSPHFLFNSLNTISSLIYKDELKAELFIRKLANMYEATLKSYHQKLITVQEELEFLRAYNYLVETRFEDKFTCTIAIDDEVLETKIPPLTLQMLVENAVKHNQLSKDLPLSVTISSTKSGILVVNNITKPPLKVTSFHIGLKNIKSRYLLLSNTAIIISKTNNFTVQIPIIK